MQLQKKLALVFFGFVVMTLLIVGLITNKKQVVAPKAPAKPPAHAVIQETGPHNYCISREPDIRSRYIGGLALYYFDCNRDGKPDFKTVKSPDGKEETFELVANQQEVLERTKAALATESPYFQGAEVYSPQGKRGLANGTAAVCVEIDRLGRTFCGDDRFASRGSAAGKQIQKEWNDLGKP